MQVYGRFPYNSQFLCKKEKKQRELLPDDPQEIEHVDTVLKLLSVITGDDSYRNIKLPEGKRKISMCDVAQNLINQGIAEGEAKPLISSRTMLKLVHNYILRELSRCASAPAGRRAAT